MLGKARRSFGISIGILLLGFMAIGFALVYRAIRDAPPPVIIEAVALPAGAVVISALISEGTINVTYTLNGDTTLSLFNQASGELTHSVAIQ
ncbi:MAG: hypothetical protein ACOH2N_04865 [Devosia sp.]